MVRAVPVLGSSAVIIAVSATTRWAARHRVAGAGSGPAEQVGQPGIGDQGGRPGSRRWTAAARPDGRVAQVDGWRAAPGRPGPPRSRRRGRGRRGWRGRGSRRPARPGRSTASAAGSRPAITSAPVDAGPGDLGLAAVAHQRGQVRVGVGQRQHVARPRWPPAARSASAWPARRPCRGRCRRPASRPGSCCRRPCPRRSRPGRGRSPRSGRRPARAALPACEQPVQPAAGRQLGGQRVVGEDARRLSRTGAPTSGHNQLNPVGTKSWAARHPGQQGAGERQPAGLGAAAAGADDLDAERRRPRTRSAPARRPAAAAGRTARWRPARGRTGGPRPRPRPSRLATLPGHHRGQLGPAVQPGVGEPQPDRGVVHRPGRRGWSTVPATCSVRAGGRDAGVRRGDGEPDTPPAARGGGRRAEHRDGPDGGDQQCDAGQRAAARRIPRTGSEGRLTRCPRAGRPPSRRAGAPRRTPAGSRSSASGTQATSSTSTSSSESSPPAASSR